MNRLIFYLAIAATGFSMQYANAQTEVDLFKREAEKRSKSDEEYRRENKERAINALKIGKKDVVDNEKEILKNEIERINKLLSDKQITAEDAQSQKEKAAKTAALNIDNKTAILDNQIELAERDQKYDIKPHSGSSIGLGLGNAYDDNGSMLLGIQYDNETQKPRYDKRTIGKVVAAGGVSNTIRDGESFRSSPYKWIRSNDSELGYMFKKRLYKDNNFTRLTYGLSFQTHNFFASNNKYFVDSEGQTTLQPFQSNLKKQHLRITNLVLPIHFEFGPSEKQVFPDRIRYKLDSWRIGFGGYAGMNIGAMQRLKYDTGNNKIDDRLKRDYNVNNFIYGVSAYIGLGPFALYMKYDLNPLFKNAAVEQRVIATGIRLDM